MCGIAGYFGIRALAAEAIKECLKRMGRRGPDNRAFKQWELRDGKHAALLHARLNIIDLDPRSNQPFQRGTKWICFNGEIYNYVELKADLASEGAAFSTASDTEVLLEMLNRYGPAGLDRCEGMWAFAMLDETDGSLLLSRDRFGEKPLYLYNDETGLYFGSEVKFITALRGRALEVNYDQLYRYMVNGYKAIYKKGHTFFEGLAEIPPATYLWISATGTPQQQRYWTPEYRPDESMSYDAAVEGVRERLLRAVQLRLRADVPLAFCMSGGVDSNSLISIAKNVFDYDVHGFTIVDVDTRYEEGEMVDYAVEQLRIRHTSISVDANGFLRQLRELVRYHDAPVYTITYYAHWLLIRSIAEQGYRISISGTAADELFTGYYDHHLAYLYTVRGDAALYAASRQAWERHVQPLVRNPFLQNPDLFIENRDLRDHVYLNAEVFEQALRVPWSEPFAEEDFTDDFLHNRMLNEMFFETVPVILHEDDLNAMYYSIENRSPFLDRELFEFSYQIPSRHLVREGRAKAVLRDAMHGIVPDRILANPRKVGFNAPILSFLDVRDPNVRRVLLEDSPVYDHVRREKVEEFVERTDLKNSESKFLFNVLNTKMFLEEFS